MVKDGIYYALGFGAAALLFGFLFGPLWASPLVLLGAFCAYFFRDPERIPPEGPVAVSPADGVISHIKQMPDGGRRVSVFLNIFNVHVNRSPVAGVVRSSEYAKGSFQMAHLESASENNEQNTLVIEAPNGEFRPLEVKQIAGLVARRIVCTKKAGDRVEKGERIGLIKFGSRMDVNFGPEWRIEVVQGDRVAAGRSILARLETPRS